MSEPSFTVSLDPNAETVVLTMSRAAFAELQADLAERDRLRYGLRSIAELQAPDNMWNPDEANQWLAVTRREIAAAFLAGEAVEKKETK